MTKEITVNTAKLIGICHEIETDAAWFEIGEVVVSGEPQMIRFSAPEEVLSKLKIGLTFMLQVEMKQFIADGCIEMQYKIIEALITNFKEVSKNAE